MTAILLLKKAPMTAILLLMSMACTAAEPVSKAARHTAVAASTAPMPEPVTLTERRALFGTSIDFQQPSNTVVHCKQNKKRILSLV